MEETVEKKVREALDSQAVIIPGFFDMDKYKQQQLEYVIILKIFVMIALKNCICF